MYSVFTQNQVLKPCPGRWCSPGSPWVRGSIGASASSHLLRPRWGPQGASSSPSTDRAAAHLSVPSSQGPGEDLPRMADWGHHCWRVWSQVHSVLPPTLGVAVHATHPRVRQQLPLSPHSHLRGFIHFSNFFYYKRHPEMLTILIFIFLIVNDFEYHIILISFSEVSSTICPITFFCLFSCWGCCTIIPVDLQTFP